MCDIISSTGFETETVSSNSAEEISDLSLGRVMPMVRLKKAEHF